MSPAASSVSWCQSCFVCSGFTYKIYSGGGSSAYIYCMVCYHVIAAPCVRSVVVSLHNVARLMMIQNIHWTMSSLYSLTCFLWLIQLCTVLKCYLEANQQVVYIWFVISIDQAFPGISTRPAWSNFMPQ